MRALALLSLMALLLGCPPPPRRPPLAPAPPVLDGVQLVQLLRMFSLKGNVVPEHAVRIFIDSACAGPVYLQTTGVALREGVQIELVAGVENVFSADAVSSEGGVSACSNAVVVTWERPQVPGVPSVSLSPGSPSKQTSFAVKGAVNSFARAQLHETDCSTPVLEELDSDRFYSTGFIIEVPPNGSRTMAVNAVNRDEFSSCTSVTAINDSIPPAFQARLASPTPSSNPAAYISFTGEPAAAFKVFAGLSCSGPEMVSCPGCNGPAYFFWVETTDFTVLGTDAAGNTNCVAGSKPWQYDPSVPYEQAAVLFPGRPLIADAPVGRDHFELFFSADCTGDATWISGWAVVNGIETSGRGGFVTVRGIRPDGAADPCSNSVALSP